MRVKNNIMKVKIEVEKRKLVCVRSCDKIESGIYNPDYWLKVGIPVIKIGDMLELTGNFKVNYSWGRETYYVECRISGFVSPFHLRVSYIETYFDDLKELRKNKLLKIELV